MMKRICVSIRPDQWEWSRNNPSVNVSGLLREAIDKLISDDEETRKVD